MDSGTYQSIAEALDAASTRLQTVMSPEYLGSVADKRAMATLGELTLGVQQLRGAVQLLLIASGQAPA